LKHKVKYIANILEHNSNNKYASIKSI